MGILSAIFQAVIQGLTEFLPVSSSGHLSLYQHFTGNSGEGALFFSAVLHLGTLVAVCIAYRKTIWAMIKELGEMFKDIGHRRFTLKNMNVERRMIIMMILSCLCLGPFVFVKDWFEGIAEDKSIFAEGLCFLYTAAILLMSDRCVKGSKTAAEIKPKDAVTVGLFQAVALLPGVSRSGSTICGALFVGTNRDTAVKYSFMLGIPTILAGCLVAIKDAVDADALPVNEIPVYMIGFAVAAVVGIAAIKLVDLLVKNNKFKYCAAYTLLLGLVVIGFGIFG